MSDTRLPEELGRIALFRDLPPAALARLAEGARRVTPADGAPLFAQGDPPDAVYAVLRKKLLLEQLAPVPGRPPRPIVRLEPLFAQARQALQALGTVQLRWVPRRCNSEADALARAAAEALEV